LNIRNANKSDLELTYRIKRKSIKPYVEKIWGWNEAYQREIHKADYIASDIKIIEHKQQEIGYLAIKENDNEIYLENLLIEKDFQNSGIGKEVMENIIDRANSGKKLIRLQVFKINFRAQRFYKNFGFIETSETENHIEMKKTSAVTTKFI